MPHSWEAEQRGLLRAKLREARDRRARVVRVAALGAIPGVLEYAWRVARSLS